MHRFPFAPLSCPLLLRAALLCALAGCGSGGDEGAGQGAESGSDAAVADAVPDAGTVGDDGGKVACKVAQDCAGPTPLCAEHACVDGRCAVVAATGSCDDGDPCTRDDRCQAGACVGLDAGCDCQQDANCAGFEDGDKCNGTLYCDQTQTPFKCRVNPSTVLQCDHGKDSVCAQNVCQPTTGKCAMKAAPNGTPCVDDDPCSVDSRCTNGQCEAGQASWCQCKQTADCAPHEDGDKCNGTLFCDKTTFPPTCRLVKSSVVKCPPSSGPCMKTACHPTKGTCETTTSPDGAICDAGTSCTNKGVCSAGKCNNDTTTCQCKTNADCADHEDGDFCNGTLYCALDESTGVCKANPATVISCPSVADTACTANKCVLKTGACVMQAVNGGGPCEDGDACTKGDVCKAGKCAAGKDACACAVDSDCVKIDDGNLCNGTGFCNLATKQCEPDPTAFVKCPTVGDTACLRSACEPSSGKCAKTRAVRIAHVKYSDGKLYPEVGGGGGGGPPARPPPPPRGGPPPPPPPPWSTCPATTATPARMATPARPTSARPANTSAPAPPTPIASRRTTATSATACCSASRRPASARHCPPAR